MLNNLKILRHSKNLTLKEVGDLVGTSKSQIYGLENGQTPRLDTAYKLAAVFGKRVHEIWPDKTKTIKKRVTITKVISG